LLHDGYESEWILILTGHGCHFCGKSGTWISQGIERQSVKRSWGETKNWEESQGVCFVDEKKF